MKSQKLKLKMVGFSLFFSVVFLSSSSWALSTAGSQIIAIDGNHDGNLTVDILSTALVSSSYSYGYFLNNSNTFQAITPNFGPFNFSSVQGGTIIDLALYDGVKYYTLSGDTADNSYSVQMKFDHPVTDGAPQLPATWTDAYYQSVNITWSLPNTTANVSGLVLDFFDGNDGVAPVPEPATLFMLGAGLIGFAVWGRNKFQTISE